VPVFREVMKRAIGVIIFAVVIITIVGLVVLLSGNDQQTSNMKPSVSNGNSSNSTLGTGIGAPVVLAADYMKHNTQADCWVVYEGKVYDITSWLPRHPGSAEAIAPYCGTMDFEKAFTDQHGQSQVGRLAKEGVYKGDLK